MPATEREVRAGRSWFVPKGATWRWVAFGLLALAGCLNPVPDTDPSSAGERDTDRPAGSMQDSNDQLLGPGPGGSGASGSSNGAVGSEAPPASQAPTEAGGPPDAGAPPSDAGADAESEDAQ